jgi:hypothetical protein
MKVPLEDWHVHIQSTTFFGVSFNDNNLKIWHERFGHVHPKMVLKMFKE